MHILRLIVAGAGIVSALVFLPALVLFATSAYPPVRTRSACRLAGAMAPRSILVGVRPSPAVHATSPDPSRDAASVAQFVRSSVKAQLRLLKLVELGLRTPRVDPHIDRP
jgi:hypothetical protein